VGVRKGVVIDSLKFHHGPTMPYPSMPFGRATPEMALRLFQGPSAPRAPCSRLLVPWKTPRRSPMKPLHLIRGSFLAWGSLFVSKEFELRRFVSRGILFFTNDIFSTDSFPFNGVFRSSGGSLSLSRLSTNGPEKLILRNGLATVCNVFTVTPPHYLT
jgi:hypothetical protein